MWICDVYLLVVNDCEIVVVVNVRASRLDLS